ncbi:lef3 [Artaxa digramma nucleopolyhedrovirus]|uniref:Lef3 n=1 Tax=Artaxa digramma nucleopolyhedrovirus TaxID=3070910 RepID=A0AAE6UZS7_9ABAC|nr:lef3 [Euproctis digramma nucleopolyhedrovirus]QHB21727.1 lef3 [Artaxa digramma nucleopolyhedrovirus]
MFKQEINDQQEFNVVAERNDCGGENEMVADDKFDVVFDVSAGDDEESQVPPNTLKRRLEENGGDDAKDAKRVKIEKNYLSAATTNAKRLSTSSLASTESNGSLRHNFKTFNGELVNKNMISINNETFYLFKFFSDNGSKEYYGTSDQYYNMKNNHVYEVSLNYENKKIYIGAYNECKVKDKLMSIKKFLINEDFDGGDTVSVYAKLKHGFKMLDDNTDTYKLIFYVKLNGENDIKEIECTSNLKRICNAINSTEIMSNEDILAYFHNNQNKIVKLQRIKCNLANRGYKSLAIITNTRIVIETDQNVVNFDLSKCNNIQNVSRMNKIVLSGIVDSINAEIVGEKFDRIAMTYKIKNDCDKEIIKACFFGNSNNSNYNNNNAVTSVNKIVKMLQRIETDVNQLNELIENDLMEVYMFVAYDLEKRNYTVLGITKYEIESKTYDSL